MNVARRKKARSSAPVRQSDHLRISYGRTMYARGLCDLLHRELSEPHLYEESLKRIEHLRGHALLPRGRENAGRRLTDAQIASAILAFVPNMPGFAGHVSLIMGQLHAVGGPRASFDGSSTVLEALTSALASDGAADSVISFSFSIDRQESGSDEYHATLRFQDAGGRRVVSFVSRMALTLLAEGAELAYDHDGVHSPVARQLTIGRKFLKRIRREVEMSRFLDLPYKADWQEYETEEERSAFHSKLGARKNSVFLNLPVETQATWPKDPIRVEFAGYHFAMFPRTNENSASISIDLATERLSAEAARTLLNRFLSLLCWCDDQPAVLGDGWSGNPVPVPVSRSQVGGSVTSRWLFSRSIPDDAELLQSLAYYREGLNARRAGLVTFEVLSFFKVFEIRAKSVRGVPNPTKVWIQQVFETVAKKLRPEAMKRFDEDRGTIEIDRYIMENCRVATAHASAEHPSDADASAEVRRLYAAAEVIHALARHSISTRYNFSDEPYSDDVLG